MRDSRSHQPAGLESADRTERRTLRPALSGHDAKRTAPYREIALREASKLGIDAHEGVYAALTGPELTKRPPKFATCATIGADLVGMSTVPEVIVARHMGIRVLGISCVTNMAAGILDQPLNHAEVLETGERVKGDFIALLRAVIPPIAADSASVAPHK